MRSGATTRSTLSPTTTAAVVALAAQSPTSELHAESSPGHISRQRVRCNVPQPHEMVAGSFTVPAGVTHAAGWPSWAAVLRTSLARRQFRSIWGWPSYVAIYVAIFQGGHIPGVRLISGKR
jgi:hypothetical protein